MSRGRVYLVGAGPGDPDLITVKALKALKEADVIVYDRLLSKEVLDAIPDTAEKIYVGKNSGAHTVPQEQIGKILVKQALKGKKVVRLKGGDPFLFGRGGEEAEELRKAGVKFEVVTGITSAFAAPAYAGIPVTHRQYSSSVAVVTGHEDPGKESSSVDWEELATAVDTIVVLMGVGRLEMITEALIRGGRDRETPAAAIEWGTTSRQRTVEGTLGDIAGKIASEKVNPPAVVVVGDVVRLRRELSWFEGESFDS
ncbi:MAG: uroporphyrinogen-III C-methyltransferase [Nitrososphaerales archaeon]